MQIAVIAMLEIMEADMGVLDKLAGGDVSAELVRVVENFIQKQGGVSGLVKTFEKQGLGPTIQSWIGSGQNYPISPAQIQRAFGFDTLREFAGKVGLSADDFAAKLAALLPKAVDLMTPGGATQARYPWTGKKKTL